MPNYKTFTVYSDLCKIHYSDDYCCIWYCFETEVANRQDRFCRKLVMMNSPLFIPFIDSNNPLGFLSVYNFLHIFNTLYILVLCCRTGEIKLIIDTLKEACRALTGRRGYLENEIIRGDHTAVSISARIKARASITARGVAEGRYRPKA